MRGLDGHAVPVRRAEPVRGRLPDDAAHLRRGDGAHRVAVRGAGPRLLPRGLEALRRERDGVPRPRGEYRPEDLEIVRAHRQNNNVMSSPADVRSTYGSAPLPRSQG